MAQQSLSMSLLLEELKELRADKVAFGQSYSIIRKRLDASIQSSRNYPPLHKWSGSRAVTGSLEMALEQINRNIEEYSEAVRLIREGVIEDLDEQDPKPVLGIIEGGDTQ